MGEDLITLTELVDIVHFAEAGPLGPDETVDISFIEGSITTPHDVERLKGIREKSAYVITVGACATSGGIQALKIMRIAIFGCVQFMQSRNIFSRYQHRVRLSSM
jgi:Coenzyme F420-reducing hydrogenase, gamma subunit